MPETDTTDHPQEESNSEKGIDIKYMKSHFFRVVHADGAFGGIGPRGDVHMSVYSERYALPDAGRLHAGEIGSLERREEIQSSGQIVRELECDIVFDYVTAVGLRNWLNDKIKELQNIIKQAQEEQRERQKKAS